MKKNNPLMTFIYVPIALAITGLALSTGAVFALYIKEAQSNGSYGKIALRSYFEKGSGQSVDDPFVITRPRHLYNLSRLQGLGVFDTKTYFQLGMEGLGGDTSGIPLCYENDVSSVTKPYLDMSSSTYSSNPINAIGSESLPFYGEFDGQNVEIKNLTVFADPQDAGLFGYTAHDSVVKNLFLSNIVINALGYTDDYAFLYSPESTIGNNAYFVYNPNDGDSATSFIVGSLDTKSCVLEAVSDENFTFDVNNSDPLPTVSVSHPNNGYNYTTLISGDLIKETNGAITLNTNKLFQFFDEKRADANQEFPLQASSNISLIVSSTDTYGIKHSKVILTLEFDFVLDSSDSTSIQINVHNAQDHSNNIGLIIGHCNGTAKDCYVYNGAFQMNNGDTLNSSTDEYGALENHSNLGLIGLVGGTVQNIVAQEADSTAQNGKSIGVIDFTTIYSNIIDEHSFDNSEIRTNGNDTGVTYVPLLTSKYAPYLRKNTSQEYITSNVNEVSFVGQKVISNTDLGVFTIATDSGTTGTGLETLTSINNSVVSSQDVSINDSYYVYYATGEYKSSSGISFSQYRDSFSSNQPSQIVVGQHFPRKTQVSKESFEYREQHHNYLVRFNLDPNYRSTHGFYFSDVDTSTDGGYYLANYFNHKLVDQSSVPIPIGSNKCGVMLKNALGQELRSLSASFGTPDLSHNNYDPLTWPVVYCVENEDREQCANNMINFNINTDYANVTVVAAPSNPNKGAALGVYKLDAGDFSTSNNVTKFTQSYDNPDFAFFMPDENHLSYFDYKVDKDGTKKGLIGTYSSAGVFTEANYLTNATVAHTYNQASEYGYVNGKTRLFAHTFKLERGRYCLGSATGALSSDKSTAKIFYVCAQGQNDGQIDFADNAFSGNDYVEGIDFLKSARYNVDGTENISLTTTDTYNPNGSELANKRLYVALINSDRSTFAAKESDITFIYNGTKFIISSSTLDAMSHVAVNNYDHTLDSGPSKVLIVSLFGNESSNAVIAYSYGS